MQTIMHLKNPIAREMALLANQILQGTELIPPVQIDFAKLENLSEHVTNCIKNDDLTECKNSILHFAQWIAKLQQTADEKIGQWITFPHFSLWDFVRTDSGAIYKADWTHWIFGDKEDLFAALLAQIDRFGIEQLPKREMSDAVLSLLHTVDGMDFKKLRQKTAQFSTQKEQLVEKISRSTAVILAGGHASRMHYYPKYRVKIGNYTFLDYIQYALEEFEQAAVSVFPGQQIPECGLPQWEDEIAEIGPISGLQTALKHSRTDTVFVIPCDMPTIRADVIAFLLEQMEPADAAVLPAVNGKINPLLGFYRTNQSEKLDDMIRNGCRRPWEFAQKISAKIVELPEQYQNHVLSFNSMQEIQDQTEKLKTKNCLPPVAFLE